MARAPQNPIQKFKEVIIDEPDTNTCYLVCYTLTRSGDNRVTSIVRCTLDEAEQEHYERILRTTDPKLWLDIRSHI